MDKCRYFCVREQFSFVILFHSFELTFFPSAIEKKGLCDPTLPFVKTIGPEVYKGEKFNYAGEQSYRSRRGMGFLLSY